MQAALGDGARLDVAANGFWGGRHERAFFDIRVFNPLAKSNSHSISSCYRKHENIKRRAYGQRIREIEHGCFTLFFPPGQCWVPLQIYLNSVPLWSIGALSVSQQSVDRFLVGGNDL